MFKKITEKDKAITDLLEKLKLITDFHLVEVVDYWEGDNCAIGLKRGGTDASEDLVISEIKEFLGI
jgi:hypothetical protein